MRFHKHTLTAAVLAASALAQLPAFAGATLIPAGSGGDLTTGPSFVSGTLIPNGSGLPDDGNVNIPMTYRGGAVMTGTVNAYIVWYGDWTTNPQYALAKTKLPEFFSSLTGSEYMNIGMTYDNGSGTPASSAVHYGGAVSLATTTTSGTVSDAAVLSNVQAAVPSLNGGVADPSGIYFLFTAPGIRQQSDTVACGWHDSTGSGANSLKFSWVSPAPGCDFLSGTVAGSNEYVDSLTETTSHEMFEAITDPNVFNGNDAGWYNDTYGENGDMCVTSNFAGILNGKTFDVQAIWARFANAQSGMCAKGFIPDATAAVPEPSSWAMMLGGVAVLAGLVRRRRKG